jgi:hypothetical protein
VLAPPRSLSQRATSFIASQRQGIRRMPLRYLITLHPCTVETTLFRAAGHKMTRTRMFTRRCLPDHSFNRKETHKRRKILFHDVNVAAAAHGELTGRNLFLSLECEPKWWSQSGSNRRPEACKVTALPTELWPRSRPAGHLNLTSAVVGPDRVELSTSRLSGVRSNHLSYGPPTMPGLYPRRRGVTSPAIARARQTDMTGSHLVARLPEWPARDGDMEKRNEGGDPPGKCP